jgi:hypothetical protein
MRLRIVLLTCALLCGACSPTYDWREVRDGDGAYTVLLPAKPSTHARAIDLDGLKLTMNMTAAEVGDTLFAVGTVRLTDPAQGPRVVQAMRTALIRNLDGTVVSEKPVQAGAAAGLQIDVRGKRVRQGQTVPVRLVARLMAHGGRAWQVLALGTTQALDDDRAETFLASFKPE